MLFYFFWRLSVKNNWEFFCTIFILPANSLSILDGLWHIEMYCFEMRQSWKRVLKVFEDADSFPRPDQNWSSLDVWSSSILALRIYGPLTEVDTTEEGSLCTQWTVVAIPSLNSAAKSEGTWFDSSSLHSQSCGCTIISALIHTIEK